MEQLTDGCFKKHIQKLIPGGAEGEPAKSYFQTAGDGDEFINTLKAREETEIIEKQLEPVAVKRVPIPINQPADTQPYNDSVEVPTFGSYETTPRKHKIQVNFN